MRRFIINTVLMSFSASFGLSDCIASSPVTKVPSINTANQQMIAELNNKISNPISINRASNGLIVSKIKLRKLYVNLAKSCNLKLIDGEFITFKVASDDKELSFLLFVPNNINISKLPQNIEVINKETDPVKKTLALASSKNIKALIFSKEKLNDSGDGYLRYINSVLEIAWAKLLYKDNYRDNYTVGKSSMFGTAINKDDFITESSASFAEKHGLLDAAKIIDSDTALGNLLFLAQNKYLPASLYYGVLKLGKENIPVISKDTKDGLDRDMSDKIKALVIDFDYTDLFGKVTDIKQIVNTHSPKTKRKRSKLSKARSTFFNGSKVQSPRATPSSYSNGNKQTKSPGFSRKTFSLKRSKSTIFNNKLDDNRMLPLPLNNNKLSPDTPRKALKILGISEKN